METLTLEISKKNKTKQEYLDINEYDGMPNNPVKFKSWDEYKQWKYEIYGEDVPEKYLDLNRFETIPALDKALAEPEGQIYTNYEDFRKDLYEDWYEEDD